MKKSEKSHLFAIKDRKDRHKKVKKMMNKGSTFVAQYTQGSSPKPRAGANLNTGGLGGLLKPDISPLE